MRLEEILKLPEVQAGRKFKRKEWNEWYSISLPDNTLFADDWELEPERKELHLGAGSVAWVSDPHETDPAVAIKSDNDSEITLLASEIDALKAFADEVRGVEKKEPEYPKLVAFTERSLAGEDPTMRQMRETYYFRGHRDGWDAAIAATKRS